MDDHGAGLKEGIVARWTFGVNVVASLAIMIIRIAWWLIALPSDDNGGGVTGAMVVGAYDFVFDLVILEIVRRVFLGFIRSGAK
jgi:hypothetical protein